MYKVVDQQHVYIQAECRETADNCTQCNVSSVVCYGISSDKLVSTARLSYVMCW